jgi:hypothetical protein
LRDAGGPVDEGIDGYPRVVRNFPMGECVRVGIIGFIIPDAEGNGVGALDSFGDMVKEFVGLLDGVLDGETVVALYGGVYIGKSYMEKMRCGTWGDFHGAVTEGT